MPTPGTSDASPQRHPANHGATIKTTTRPRYPILIRTARRRHRHGQRLTIGHSTTRPVILAVMVPAIKRDGPRGVLRIVPGHGPRQACFLETRPLLTGTIGTSVARFHRIPADPDSDRHGRHGHREQAQREEAMRN
jgi:hypothetical protein